MESRLTIISGGQTGVDRAALDAAIACGVPAGGWCPEGRLAEDGTIPGKYPLRELAGAGYIERTRRNVIDSDGTAIIYFAILSGGTRKTRAFCRHAHKPHVLVDAAATTQPVAVRTLRAFIEEHDITVLNVAGPRASSTALAYPYTFAVVSAVLAGLGHGDGSGRRGGG